MLEILNEVEENLPNLLRSNIEMKSLFIDYHPPIVERIWFNYGEYRVYLHKILLCKQEEALFHPHPWPSAVKILEGCYEMGIGHSENNLEPDIDCKLVLGPGSEYEMSDINGWHYVRPLIPVYSIIVTGKPWGRFIPIEPM